MNYAEQIKNQAAMLLGIIALLQQTDLSYAEIARRLGCSGAYVRYHARQAGITRPPKWKKGRCKAVRNG